MKEVKTAVIALGGNSITREFEEGNIAQQWANTRRSLIGIIELIKRNYRTVITHGNGPQVGNNLIRVEESRHVVPPLPLGVIVADLQGGMGYMIQQTLQNRLHELGIDRAVCTILTQVVVDKNDPSILNPTKFVGPFVAEAEIGQIAEERGWTIKEDPGRGFRRVVPSPRPLEIVEKTVIDALIEEDVLLICCGGGGIPVYRKENGTLEGVDGVIDKDLAAAVLGRDIGAQELYIFTAVDKVCLNFRKSNEVALDHLTVKEARNHMRLGQFPSGSMGPKIQAAISFIEFGGQRVVISSVDRMTDAIHGKTGTRIEP